MYLVLIMLKLMVIQKLLCFCVTEGHLLLMQLPLKQEMSPVAAAILVGLVVYGIPSQELEIQQLEVLG